MSRKWPSGAVAWVTRRPCPVNRALLDASRPAPWPAVGALVEAPNLQITTAMAKVVNCAFHVQRSSAGRYRRHGLRSGLHLATISLFRVVGGNLTSHHAGADLTPLRPVFVVGLDCRNRRTGQAAGHDHFGGLPPVMTPSAVPYFGGLRRKAGPRKLVGVCEDPSFDPGRDGRTSFFLRFCPVF